MVHLDFALVPGGVRFFFFMIIAIEFKNKTIMRSLVLTNALVWRTRDCKSLLIYTIYRRKNRDTLKIKINKTL